MENLAWHAATIANQSGWRKRPLNWKRLLEADPDRAIKPKPRKKESWNDFNQEFELRWLKATSK